MNGVYVKGGFLPAVTVCHLVYGGQIAVNGITSKTIGTPAATTALPPGGNTSVNGLTNNGITLNGLTVNGLGP